MKLGTETGSVMNHLYSRATRGQPEPAVGMGATVLLWTDRTAGTIVAVHETPRGLVVSVQDDRTRVIAGSAQDGSADYAYEPNPDGYMRHFRRGDDGRWEQVQPGKRPGTWKKSDCGRCGLRIGEREEYRDPTF